jgi:hypothetical protein
MAALRRWFRRLAGRHQKVLGIIRWKQVRRLFYAVGCAIQPIWTAWIRLKSEVGGDEADAGGWMAAMAREESGLPSPVGQSRFGRQGFSLVLSGTRFKSSKASHCPSHSGGWI